MTLGTKSNPIPIHRSGLLDLRRCPRYYFYRYLSSPSGTFSLSTPSLGLDSALSNPDLVIGSAIHKALEVALLGQSTQSEMEAAAFPILTEAAQKGWSMCNLGFEEEATAHYRQILRGMIWLCRRQILPYISSRYQVIETEKEMDPLILQHPTSSLYYAFQSRIDGVLRELGSNHPVLLSWKSCATYTSELSRNVEFDDQGLSESLAFYHSTGEWPSVLMPYIAKGRKERGITPFKTFSGIWSTLYTRGLETTPSYRKGWDKTSVAAHFGPGDLDYWDSLLLQDPTLFDDYWATPPVTTRSPHQAEEWLHWAIEDFDRWYSRAISTPTLHPESFAPYPSGTLSYKRVCTYHDTCKGLIPLSSLVEQGRFVPRDPHHPSSLEGWDD